MWKSLFAVSMLAGTIAALVLAGPGALLVAVPVIGGLVALIWGETPSTPTRSHH